MAKKISKYLAILYSYIMAPITKRSKCASNNILIIEGGHIGDAIMDSSALSYMAEYYVKSGKKVYFLCSPPLWDMLKRISPMKNVEYVGEEYSYNQRLFDPIWKVYARLKNINFDTIIGINNCEPRMHCLISYLNAGKKLGLIEDQSDSRLFLKYKKQFIKRCYTNLIWGDRSKFQLRWMNQLMQELQISGYKVKNSFIKPCSDVRITNKTYIAIAVDSANPVRRWPAHNFNELINKLLENFEDDIYLIGKNIDVELKNEIASGKLSGNDRIKDMVGKTSLEEWIEMIRGSRFLIGVDSGSIHVAAAVGTLAFCMTGVWSGHKCMPYDVDVIETGTKLPICIYRKDTSVDDLSCYDCGFYCEFGHGNSECFTQCNSGQPLLCLSKITPDDVIAEIDHALETGVIQ